MSEIDDSLSTAIVVMLRDTETLHEFVHGPDTVEVETESGAVPTVGKLVKDLKQEIGSITTDAVESASSAKIAATEAGRLSVVARDAAAVAEEAVAGIGEAVVAVEQNAQAAAAAVGSASEFAEASSGSSLTASQAAAAAGSARTEAVQAADRSVSAASTVSAGSARFLAPAATLPTVRDDGTPLREGDQFQSTTTKLSYNRVSGAWAPLNEGVQQVRLDLADPAKGAALSAHGEGNVAGFLDSLTTGLGDFSANNMLQIHVGDSTVEQAGGSGFLFDFITTYWRGPGMPANGMLGTINFGGSGYRLRNFVEDPLNAAFVGPTGAMPGVTAGPGQWDYYGHKPSGAVSLATALKYRSGVPVAVKHVQWVFCYGINDLILYNDVGTGTVESIANYIAGYLVKAMGRVQAAFPGDSIVLRMPNPMVARPYNAAFPSASAYPTFDTDLAASQQLVSNWNAGLRLAYQKAQNIFPRSVLFDTGAKVFGSSDPTVSPGQTAGTNPTLQDRVHPSSFGYRQIGHELFNQLFGNQQVRQCYNGRRFMADLKITNGWAGNAWDYYGQYFRNNQKFKELGSFNLVGAGATYMDVDAEPNSLKKVLAGFGAGRIFCTVGTDDLASTSLLLGNFTSMAIGASGTNSRITGVVATAVAGSRSIVTFYTDNFLSPPKISFAGQLVQGQSVFTAVMDIVPSGLASLTVTTTLAVPTNMTVEIYRHISNTRTLIATTTLGPNGFNKTLVSGTDFTAINSIGLLQEVWEILPTTATSIPAGCALKLTLNPN